MIGALWLALALHAHAAAPDDPAAPTDDPAAPIVDPEVRESLAWGGYVLPIAGANTVDGFGFGLGGELYGREPDEAYGYAYKLTAGTWFTTTFEYTSHFLQLEHRGRAHHLVRLGYQGWSNLVYGGAGGADVLVDWGDREIGNRFLGPYALLAAARPLHDASPWRVYGQAYARYAHVEPGAGSLLAERAPTGHASALYQDATLGLEHERLDRWPMPTDGVRVELDARVGATVTEGRVLPLVGLHAEAIRWWPVLGERLVVGGRLLAARTFGHRPFFEQNLTGGRWRDELGYEQALVGYGRTRTRGDGVTAGMIELRPFLGRTNHDVWDFAFSLSLFAEEAFLFDGMDPGPHLPTVGFGPVVLFQGASQLRPFLAWGWRADQPGADRAPAMQFGLSLTDPL